jgi:hypothetical protein
MFQQQGDMDMTFEEAKLTKALMENDVAETNAALALFPRSAMGLTPDDVKASPEFRAAKVAFEKSFGKLRAFNGVITKKFAKEMRQERLMRRAG